MAKTAALKKKGSTSVHSRAAKRATSPGIDLDKSIKDIKPPTDLKIQRPSVLAVHQNAGVSKKSKNGRKSVLSAKAKKRHEKGMDRAEAVMDQKETKVEKSKDRARTVQERAKAWDDLNKKILAKKAKEEGQSVAKDQENLVDEDEAEAEAEVEVDMEVEMENATEVEQAHGIEAMVTEDAPNSVPLPKVADDEDEIL